MNFARAALFGLSLAALCGCATSNIENAWVDPTATSESFSSMKKVLTVAMSRDGAVRRTAEDALANALNSGPRGQSGELHAHPSYTLLDDRELFNKDAAKAKVEAAGYDGAVLISFVSTQQRVTSTGPSYYGGFWGHYGYVYGPGAGYYDPGTIRTDTILRLQISIYSLREDKLLWSGVSKTMNPSRIDELVGGVAKAVADDLRKRGLIQ